MSTHQIRYFPELNSFMSHQGCTVLISEICTVIFHVSQYCMIWHSYCVSSCKSNS